MPRRKYKLEYEWTWGYTNQEEVFFVIEKDSPEDTEEAMDARAIKHAKRVFQQICPGHGSKRIIRLSLVDYERKSGSLHVYETSVIKDFTKE